MATKRFSLSLTAKDWKRLHIELASWRRECDKRAKNPRTKIERLFGPSFRNSEEWCHRIINRLGRTLFAKRHQKTFFPPK